MLYVNKVMGRVMHDVANNPSRIDVDPVEPHNRMPLDGRQL